MSSFLLTLSAHSSSSSLSVSLSVSQSLSQSVWLCSCLSIRLILCLSDSFSLTLSYFLSPPPPPPPTSPTTSLSAPSSLFYHGMTVSIYRVSSPSDLTALSCRPVCLYARFLRFSSLLCEILLRFPFAFHSAWVLPIYMFYLFGFFPDFCAKLFPLFPFANSIDVSASFLLYFIQRSFFCL